MIIIFGLFTTILMCFMTIFLISVMKHNKNKKSYENRIVALFIYLLISSTLIYGWFEVIKLSNG
jgi:hypothetical protein